MERGSGDSVYKAVNQKNKTLFSECDTVVMFLKYKNNPVGSWANLYEKCTLHPVRCVWPAAALCSHTSRPVQTVTLFARAWEIPYRHWNILTFTQIFTFIYKEHYWELPTSVLYFCVLVIYENYNTTSKQEKIMDLPINYPFRFLFFSLYSHQCFPHIHLLVPHTSVNSMMWYNPIQWMVVWFLVWQ